MLEIMFELPDQPDGSAFEISQDVVEGRNELFSIPEPQTKSA